MSTFGQRLHLLRNEKGLRQKEVGSRPATDMNAAGLNGIADLPEEVREIIKEYIDYVRKKR